MLSRPAVIVHGLDQARAALRPGYPVTLLSAAGAARYAGCLWWRSLIAAARAGYPATPALDVLDCGTAPGWAMAALRMGQRILVLDPASPAFPAVRAAGAGIGALVLPVAPKGLDLAERGAARRLGGWLASTTDDTPGGVGYHGATKARPPWNIGDSHADHAARQDNPGLVRER